MPQSVALPPAPSLPPGLLDGLALNYDSPAALKELINRLDYAMRKRYGQNFLVSRKARKRIVDLAEIREGMETWEIGPGIGALTELILETSASLKAFEIDEGFAGLLSTLYGRKPNFTLVAGDFLKTWKAAYDLRRPERIIGNLPYNVASLIIATAIEEGIMPERMVFTVQKEAAARMCASPGTKDYSAFSVLCRSATTSRAAFDIGASSFWPAPRVTSTVVLFEPRRDPVGGEDRKAFSAFTRSLFSSRRKTIRNNLKATYPDEAIAEALASCGLRPDIRAEALEPEAIAEFREALRALAR